MVDDVFALEEQLPPPEPERPSRPHGTGPFLFLQSIRSALGRTPLWLVTWCALSLLAAVAALPWYRWYAGATANRVAPGEAVYNLSEAFRFDHARQLATLDNATAELAVALAFAATLLGVFAAGGWLQVILERAHGVPLRRFFYGGARYFWRFFRVTILVMLALGLLGWITHGLPWERLVLGRLKGIPEADWSKLETLGTELQARKLGWLQDGVTAFGFVLVMIWAVFMRTRLALHDTRSVLWAGGCTFFNLFRRPIKMLRPMLLLLLTEILVVSVFFGRVAKLTDTRLKDETSWKWIATMWVVGALALAFRQILFGARYQAAVKVSREIIRPTSRPDPWRSIGGPGGPQYPVGKDKQRFTPLFPGAEDEYGA